MIRAWPAASLVPVVAVALLGGAERAAGQSEEAARAILRRCHDAVVALPAVHFSASREVCGAAALGGVGGVGGVAGEPAVTGTVRIEEYSFNSLAAWSMVVRAEVNPGPSGASEKLDTWLEGAEMAVMRHASKQYVGAAPEDFEQALSEGAGALVGWLAGWDRVAGAALRQGSAAEVTRQGERWIGGEVCDVVRIDWRDAAGATRETWLSVARSDSLPRRVEVGTVGAGGPGFDIVTITQLVKDPEHEPGAMSRSIPPEYQIIVEYTPPKNRARAKAPPPHAAGSAAPGVAVGTRAPDWVLAEPSGRLRRLSEFRGRVVVMDFWATWCPPCAERVAAISQAAARHAGEPVTLLSVAAMDGGEPAAEFRKGNFGQTLLLMGDPVAEAYGVDSVPSLVVVGADGRLLSRRIGAEKDFAQVLEAEIASALAGAGREAPAEAPAPPPPAPAPAAPGS